MRQSPPAISSRDSDSAEMPVCLWPAHSKLRVRGLLILVPNNHNSFIKKELFDSLTTFNIGWSFRKHDSRTDAFLFPCRYIVLAINLRLNIPPNLPNMPSYVSPDRLMRHSVPVRCFDLHYCYTAIQIIVVYKYVYSALPTGLLNNPPFRGNLSFSLSLPIGLNLLVEGFSTFQRFWFWSFSVVGNHNSPVYFGKTSNKKHFCLSGGPATTMILPTPKSFSLRSSANRGILNFIF